MMEKEKVMAYWNPPLTKYKFGEPTRIIKKDGSYVTTEEEWQEELKWITYLHEETKNEKS